MDFRDNARLDTSQVSDVRGRGGMGGGRGMAVGGGGLGIVGLLIALVLGVNPADLAGAGGADTAYQDPGAGTGISEVERSCQSGADADQREDCRLVAVVNSVQDYWAGTLEGYTPSQTQLFSGQTTTGCGAATSAVGPFYCPADQGVYIDLDFFDVLETQYGASGGDFAQAYVIAHEYGHHVQNLTGQSEDSRRLPDQEGPQGASVRLELQADCYAGVWAANASRDGFITFDDTDIQEGLSAASAVGDDRIQEKAQGRVTPESWTHGSAEQRRTWFMTGLKSADPRACDTFSAPKV
jgi:predicted metalloprotease